MNEWISLPIYLSYQVPSTIFPTCVLIDNLNVGGELPSELEGFKLGQQRSWFSSFSAGCRNVSAILFVSVFLFHHTTLTKHFIVNKVFHSCKTPER